MTRFLIGLVVGAALAFGYVRYDVALPAVLQLPDRLKGNVITTTIEADLYAIGGDAGVRRRALETYFANRAADAAKVDAEAGHPFLAVLHRQRAQREARILAGEWSAYGTSLAKPELRTVLERRHGTTDEEALKRHMLAASLDKTPFLKQWLAAQPGQDGSDLLATLRRLAAR